MGTSKTSSGPGKGVPLLPSWLTPEEIAPTLPLSPPTVPDDGTVEPMPDEVPGETPTPPLMPISPTPHPIPAVAEPRRFTSARRAIGRYTKTADIGSLRAALGNYVKSGYGGSGTASRRMQRGVSAASGVYDLLSRGADAGDASADAPSLDLRSLVGLSHSEIAERIADAVNPAAVSLDDAGVREAVAQAVSTVLSENENVDVTNMPPELVEECFVRTLSISAFNVVLGDIGASIQRAAHGDFALANNRMKEISDYVREAYRAQYENQKASGGTISRRTASALARTITAQVMSIFESYLE